MGEKKLFEEILEQQESFYEDQQAETFEKENAEAEERILNSILIRVSPEHAQKIQDGYEEYKLARKKLFEKKRGNRTLRDIEDSIPNNLWINIMYKKEPSEKYGLPDLNEILKKLEKEGKDKENYLNLK